MDSASLDLFVGDEAVIVAGLTPADAGNVTFKSSNSSVVIVDVEGNVIANGKGQAIITVSFAGDNKYAASENRTVAVDVSLNDASVTVDNDTLDLKVDERYAINATVNPDTILLDITYASSDNSVASVDENGIVTAVGEGAAVITLSVGDGEIYAKNSTKVTVAVSKISPEITISDIAGNVGETVNATVSIAGGDATGTILFNDVSYIVKDGQATIPVVIAHAGMQGINVVYSGDGKYNNGSANKGFNAGKGATSIEVGGDSEIKVGENATVGVTVNPNSVSGDVGITVDGNLYDTVAVDKGIASVVISGLTNGTHTVAAKYNGDANYNASDIASLSITVTKMDPSEDIGIDMDNITHGQNATVNVRLPDDATGNVTLKVDGNEVATAPAKDGSAKWTLTELNAGNHTVEITYSGDDKYASANASKELSVLKQNATADIEMPANMTVGENSTANVKLPSDATGNVTVTVDGSEVSSVPVTNGSADITMPPLSAGNHTVEIAYSGDGNYNPVTQTKEITVLKQNATADVTVPTDITVGEDSTVSVKLPRDATGNVTVKVDGKTVDTVPVTNGTADLTISSLKAGKHTVEIAYSGDDKHNPVTQTKDITVSKNDASPEIAVDDETVNVRLPSDATGNVSVKVDGETVSTVPVTEGTASVELPKLSAGNHTVEIAYFGDDKYNPSTKTATVSVDVDTSILTAKNVTATYNVKKYLTITLTDSTGSPIANATVTVKLKSAKNYTTDDEGQIKVKVSNLVPKTYTAQITFRGNDKYIGSDTAAKVKVKKATPKITAKKKTFKTTAKTKKYTVKLKNNKGKAIKKAKVSLKVNGKTYKAKTNSKGKATFNLKKLNEKGTYKAVIKYKGNKYYKKLTKKAKITVKRVWVTVSKGSPLKNTVKEIQNALKAKGYYLSYNEHYLMVDGIYDIYTEAAVEQFQNDNGLKVTGKVDEKTALILGII